jgi:hypothetical protein
LYAGSGRCRKGPLKGPSVEGGRNRCASEGETGAIRSALYVPILPRNDFGTSNFQISLWPMTTFRHDSFHHYFNRSTSFSHAAVSTRFSITTSTDQPYSIPSNTLQSRYFGSRSQLNPRHVKVLFMNSTRSATALRLQLLTFAYGY